MTNVLIETSDLEATLDLLIRARAELKRRGFLQRAGYVEYSDYDNPDAKVCAVGALKVVDYDALYFTAWNLLDAVSPGNYGVVDFNDRATTTKNDVLAVYDKAIALVKEEIAEAQQPPRDSGGAPIW